MVTVQRVIVVGRTFRDTGAERVSLISSDLSEMKQARSVAEELPAETLDMLFLSSGRPHCSRSIVGREAH